MTAKKSVRKTAPAAAAVVIKKLAADAKHVLSPQPAGGNTDLKDPVYYSTIQHSAQVIAAAGLRNGMSPAEVHKAIARVIGEPKA